MPIVNRGPCACCNTVTLVGFEPLAGPNCSNVPFTWTSAASGYCTSSTNMYMISARYSDNSVVVFEAYFPAMAPWRVVDWVDFGCLPFTYDGKCYMWKTALRFYAPYGTNSPPYPQSAVLTSGARATTVYPPGWGEVECQ